MAVTGIGGISFRVRDPDALATWYRTHFGITAPDEAVWHQQAGPTVFIQRSILHSARRGVVSALVLMAAMH